MRDEGLTLSKIENPLSLWDYFITLYFTGISMGYTNPFLTLFLTRVFFLTRK